MDKTFRNNNSSRSIVPVENQFMFNALWQSLRRKKSICLKLGWVWPPDRDSSRTKLHIKKPSLVLNNRLMQIGRGAELAGWLAGDLSLARCMRRTKNKVDRCYRIRKSCKTFRNYFFCICTILKHFFALLRTCLFRQRYRSCWWEPNPS